MSLRLTADAVLLPDHTILDGGAIDIADDGRIDAVGTIADLPAHEGTVEVVGGLLMPGLVNAHAHTPMTLVRSAGDGLPLQEWLTTAVWPREGQMTPVDAYWGMLLGSAEMLLSGVTTSCEMYFFDGQVVQAVRDSGARIVSTPGVVSVMLPDGDPTQRIDELTRFHAENHDPDAGINIGLAPHSVYDLGPEHVGEIARRARDVDALFHIHLEETAAERQLVIDNFGATATELLAREGVLDGKVIAAHGVWLSESDMALLGDAGAAVAHCPISNLKLGSGIADVAAMRTAGITVGLGTDGAASNDALDLWQEMKIAPLLARGTAHDPQAMTASTALELATTSAAKAIGLDDVGAIAPGMRADLIRIDLDAPMFAPGDDLLAHLVYAGSGRHVTDVWVSGRRVVKARECLTVDVAEAVVECRQRGRQLRDDL